MKKQWIAVAVFFAVATGGASAQTATNLTFTANVGVPDGDLNGLVLTASLSGIDGLISGLTVNLNISGGENSDLYAYLAGPNGGFAVLLNRVGMGAANPAGYTDTGFALTLDDAAAANIHDYQGAGYSLNGNGQLTGTWAPDGRNVDPQSPPETFDAMLPTATLASFLNTDPNGTWTFYIADVSGGAQSTVNSVELNVAIVPEPGALALAALGGLGLLWLRFRK